MWCINLSNLATGILWTLLIANTIAVIWLVTVACSAEYWQAKLRDRVEDCENNIEYLKKKGGKR